MLSGSRSSSRPAATISMAWPPISMELRAAVQARVQPAGVEHSRFVYLRELRSAGPLGLVSSNCGCQRLIHSQQAEHDDSKTRSRELSLRYLVMGGG